MHFKIEHPPGFHIEETGFSFLRDGTDYTAYMDGVSLTRISQRLDGKWAYDIGARPNKEYRIADTLNDAITELKRSLLADGKRLDNVVPFRPPE